MRQFGLLLLTFAISGSGTKLLARRQPPRLVLFLVCHAARTWLAADLIKPCRQVHTQTVRRITWLAGVENVRPVGLLSKTVARQVTWGTIKRGNKYYIMHSNSYSNSKIRFIYWVNIVLHSCNNYQRPKSCVKISLQLRICSLLL
jgi:hypothetical protein